MLNEIRKGAILKDDNGQLYEVLRITKNWAFFKHAMVDTHGEYYFTKQDYKCHSAILEKMTIVKE